MGSFQKEEDVMSVSTDSNATHQTEYVHGGEIRAPRKWDGLEEAAFSSLPEEIRSLTVDRVVVTSRPMASDGTFAVLLLEGKGSGNGNMNFSFESGYLACLRMCRKFSIEATREVAEMVEKSTSHCHSRDGTLEPIVRASVDGGFIRTTFMSGSAEALAEHARGGASEMELRVFARMGHAALASPERFKLPASRYRIGDMDDITLTAPGKERPFISLSVSEGKRPSNTSFVSVVQAIAHMSGGLWDALIEKSPLLAHTVRAVMCPSEEPHPDVGQRLSLSTSPGQAHRQSGDSAWMLVVSTPYMCGVVLSNMLEWLFNLNSTFSMQRPKMTERTTIVSGIRSVYADVPCASLQRETRYALARLRERVPTCRHVCALALMGLGDLSTPDITIALERFREMVRKLAQHDPIEVSRLRGKVLTTRGLSGPAAAVAEIVGQVEVRLKMIGRGGRWPNLVDRRTGMSVMMIDGKPFSTALAETQNALASIMSPSDAEARELLSRLPTGDVAWPITGEGIVFSGVREYMVFTEGIVSATREHNAIIPDYILQTFLGEANSLSYGATLPARENALARTVALPGVQAYIEVCVKGANAWHPRCRETLKVFSDVLNAARVRFPKVPSKKNLKAESVGVYASACWVLDHIGVIENLEANNRLGVRGIFESHNNEGQQIFDYGELETDAVRRSEGQGRLGRIWYSEAENIPPPGRYRTSGGGLRGVRIAAQFCCPKDEYQEERSREEIKRLAANMVDQAGVEARYGPLTLKERTYVDEEIATSNATERNQLNSAIAMVVEEKTESWFLIAELADQLAQQIGGDRARLPEHLVVAAIQYVVVSSPYKVSYYNSTSIDGYRVWFAHREGELPPPKKVKEAFAILRVKRLVPDVDEPTLEDDRVRDDEDDIFAMFDGDEEAYAFSDDLEY